MSYDLGTAHGKIVLDYDSDRAVGRAEHDIDKLERKAKESNGTLGKLGKTLSVLGSGAKIGLLAGAMGQTAISASSLLIQLLGMVPQLASIVSLSAALPGLYAGIGATVLTLKAAFAGVADAVKLAFDPKKSKQFEESLKNLSPEAARFVRAIHSAAPELQNFQKEIQNTFFKAAGLADIFSRNFLGALKQVRPQIVGLAQDLGDVVGKLANFATNSQTISFVADAVQVFRAAIAGSADPLLKLLGGLRDVGEVGLPLLLQMADAVNDLIARFGEWLSAVANDGRLQDWIDTAIDTLGTLATIVKNVGNILLPILQAANDTGGGLLNTIAGITGEFAKFVNSAEGGEAIRTLFSGIMELAKQLAPIITTVVGVLAQGLGPALGRIATNIGPVLLDVVNRLAPAIAPLANALADLLIAVAPLVPPIAELVRLLAGILTVVIQDLVAEFGPLIKIIGDTLVKAFEALRPAIDVMAQGLPLAAEAGAQLAEAFAPLAPVIVDLAKAIADTLVQVAPQLMEATKALIPVFVELAKALAGELINAIKILVVILPPMVKLFATLAPFIANVATIGFRLVTWIINLVAWLRNAIPALGAFIAQLVQGLGGGIVKAYNAVVSAGALVINWFQQLPGRILAFLQAFPGMLKDLFVKALEGLATAIGFSAGLIVGIFTKLPGRIADAIVTLGPILWAWIQNVWNGVTTGVYNGITNAVNVAKAAPGRIYNAVRSLISLLGDLAKNAWNNLVSRFNTGVGNATSTAKNLPGRIKSALGNLGSLLLNSGIDIINGLINGINRGIGKVLGLVSNLANRVKGAFNDALSIFSPSREFVWSGNMIGEGLMKGITDKLRAVRQVAEQLANTVIAPTAQLPSTAGSSAQQAVTAMATKTAQAAQAESGGRQFGPYNINVGNETIAQLMIDAITGNPIVVSKSADEGKRVGSWAGSGRSN